jgi:hypothetical protein
MNSLTSALDGGEWSAPRPSHFTPSTHWIGGWVGPRAIVDSVKEKNFQPLQDSNPDYLARSQ